MYRAGPSHSAGTTAATGAISRPLATCCATSARSRVSLRKPRARTAAQSSHGQRRGMGICFTRSARQRELGRQPATEIQTSKKEKHKTEERRTTWAHREAELLEIWACIWDRYTREERRQSNRHFGLPLLHFERSVTVSYNPPITLPVIGGWTVPPHQGGMYKYHGGQQQF